MIIQIYSYELDGNSDGNDSNLIINTYKLITMENQANYKDHLQEQ